jgi:hypothetical protein
MLVRLTVAKRFLKDNFLYRKARIYDVPEDMGMTLCSLMQKDMPQFAIIDPANVGKIPVVSLQIEDYVPDTPVVPQNVSVAGEAKTEKQVSPKKAKTAKKSTAKKKSPKLKKPTAKTEKSSNVVQV